MSLILKAFIVNSFLITLRRCRHFNKSGPWSFHKPGFCAKMWTTGNASGKLEIVFHMLASPMLDKTPTCSLQKLSKINENIRKIKTFDHHSSRALVAARKLVNNSRLIKSVINPRRGVSDTEQSCRRASLDEAWISMWPSLATETFKAGIIAYRFCSGTVFGAFISPDCRAAGN